MEPTVARLVRLAAADHEYFLLAVHCLLESMVADGCSSSGTSLEANLGPLARKLSPLGLSAMERRIRCHTLREQHRSCGYGYGPRDSISALQDFLVLMDEIKPSPVGDHLPLEKLLDWLKDRNAQQPWQWHQGRKNLSSTKEELTRAYDEFTDLRDRWARKPEPSKRQLVAESKKQLLHHHRSYSLEILAQASGSMALRSNDDYLRRFGPLSLRQDMIQTVVQTEKRALITGPWGSGKSAMLALTAKAWLQGSKTKEHSIWVITSGPRSLTGLQDLFHSMEVETAEVHWASVFQLIKAFMAPDTETSQKPLTTEQLRELLPPELHDQSTALLRTIEHRVWAQNLTRDQVDRLPQLGTVDHGTSIWELQQALGTVVRDQGLHSERLMLLEFLENGLDLGTKTSNLRLLVDDAQDLSPVELELIHRLKPSQQIYAWAPHQQIYGAGGDPRHWGRGWELYPLDRGYRNSEEIQRFTENFAKNFDVSLPLREAQKPLGIGVQVQFHPSQEKAISQILRSVDRLIGEEGYAESDILLLVPRWDQLEQLATALAPRKLTRLGEQAKGLHHRGIRWATIQGSKGHEAPVVLLYLPTLPPIFVGDQGTGQTMAQTLALAFTRARFQLQLFVNDQVPSLKAWFSPFE